MFNINYKKGVLISSLFILLSIFLILPISHGYGSSFGTAETITTGTRIEPLYSSDNYAYYKVDCSQGNYLMVSLTFSPSFDLDLRLYDPAESYVDGSTSSTGGSEHCSELCSSSGYYYIKVSRYDGIGDVSMTITVSITTGVPGFEGIYILFALMVSIGLFIYIRIRKSRIILK